MTLYTFIKRTTSDTNIIHVMKLRQNTDGTLQFLLMIAYATKQDSSLDYKPKYNWLIMWISDVMY